MYIEVVLSTNHQGKSFLTDEKIAQNREKDLYRKKEIINIWSC